MTSVHRPGDTRILYRECATLAEGDYDVVLVAREGRFPMPPGVRYHPIAAPRNRLERFTKTAYAVYRAAVQEDADIYHFHDPELIGVGLAMRAHGKEVIFDVHEDLPADIAVKPWIWAPLRGVVARLTCALLSFVQRRFTAIVAATPSIAAQYPHARAIVVQNFPRIEELSPDGESAPYETRPPYAVYIGSVTALRGAVQMVQAMSKPALPDEARLLLVGEFETPGLEANLQALPGWNKTVALGLRSRAELPSILAQARVALLTLQPVPDHYGALPTKLLEYMAAGLPVVTARSLTRCCEIVERVGCGFAVDSTDPEAIADAITRLLRDPHESRRMGVRGRSAVTMRYEWSVEAPKLLALYDRLARRSPV